MGSSQQFHAICKLSIPEVKIVFPDNKKDFYNNNDLILKTSFTGYFSDILWKINDEIYEDEAPSAKLTEVGVNNVEFWGKYVTGATIYLCEIFYVSPEKVTTNLQFDVSKIKTIKTEFKMHYNNKLHFTQSNSPVAPRFDGGYYIAVSDTDKYLHILSFDKDDYLIKDFNITEKAIPHDITTTYLGFAVYVVDSNNIHHSYLLAYDKDFKNVKSVVIMNNDVTGDKKKNDSTPEFQLIRYNEKSKPVFGIRFIFQADNAKLVYSRGRIFLIFAHYNTFDDDWSSHTADTVTTFSDDLEDVDFGIVWGASHSLIQSACFDENYFWSATLSDAYPNGIRVEYTSKKEFSNSYDAVAKKYNSRKAYYNDTLAGTIKVYTIGWADGKLGSILYFENLELYCLVYAKTPNHSSDDKNNKNIIYITAWKFINEKIEQTTIKEITVLDKINIMQVRAGKLGDDQVFITYFETGSAGHNYYGNIPKGSSPYVVVVKLPNFEIIQKDEKIGKILMNTNEDLRTFRDGVLIWATADSNNYLVINKIGVEPAPSVTWKDVYGLTTVENEEGNQVPSLKMKGITSNEISSDHSFFIVLVYKSKVSPGLRSLEGEEETEIRIQAKCTISNPSAITSNDVNEVDYTCVGDTDKDLAGFTLTNIEDGNNGNTLKDSNLDTLISEIKGENEDLSELKSTSEFSLSNMFIFKMTDNLLNVKAEDFKFNFTIVGTLDKELAIEGNKINVNFGLVEVNDIQMNCIFEIGESQQASLTCDLNVENYKNINEFSFKTSEIKQDGKEIYLSKFNEIVLINSDNLVFTEESVDEDDDDNKTVVIVVSVVCSVVAACGIGIGLFFLIRKIKAKGISEHNDVKEMEQHQTVKTSEAISSGNRVIKYKN